MKKRGRKSTAELATTTPQGLIEKTQRPDAPYTLSDVEANEWRSIVARMPADWFTRETWPLLEQYCRHAVRAWKVSKLLTQMESTNEVDVDHWLKLLSAQERESRALAMLARQMRLSQVSTMRQDRTAKPETQGPKPWEFTGIEE
jgi:hypothetical protein